MNTNNQLSTDELMLVKAALIALKMELGKEISELDKRFYELVRPALLESIE